MVSAKEENNIREEGMGDQGAAVVTGLSGKVLLRRRHLKKDLKVTGSEPPRDLGRKNSQYGALSRRGTGELKDQQGGRGGWKEKAGRKKYQRGGRGEIM